MQEAAQTQSGKIERGSRCYTCIDVSDPVERKRRQNLLRQKAFRQRRSTSEKKRRRQVVSTRDSSWIGFGMLTMTDQNESVNATKNSHGPGSLPRLKTATPAANPHDIPTTKRLIPPLLPYSTPTTYQILPEIQFPLSADHRLIVLVQYNVVRALLFNMSILSLTDTLPMACGHCFKVPSFGTIPPDQVPPDLQRTPLQISAPPFPLWINAIPVPRMRDNLIIHSGKCDYNDLGYDLGQSLYEGADDVERRGFLTWGDPWRVDGWEVSEGFVKKWGFLLEGCEDLIESTNRWREIRGEDRQVLEI